MLPTDRPLGVKLGTLGEHWRADKFCEFSIKSHKCISQQLHMTIKLVLDDK